MTLIKLNNKLISFSGKLLSVPDNVIYDGNTVAWYDSTDLSTITKDGSDYVSLWKDKLNSGHDLIQLTGTSQPKWFNNDGILFDGTNDFMKTNTFTLIQPTFIYMVTNVHTPRYYDYFFDGYLNNTGTMLSLDDGLQYYCFAGSPSGFYSDMIYNSYCIIRVKFNNTNSKVTINNLPNHNFNSGTNNMNGFTLSGMGQSHWSNLSIQNVKEIILRKVVDTTENETIIYNYLKNKYNL